MMLRLLQYLKVNFSRSSDCSCSASNNSLWGCSPSPLFPSSPLSFSSRPFPRPLPFPHSLCPLSRFPPPFFPFHSLLPSPFPRSATSLSFCFSSSLPFSCLPQSGPLKSNYEVWGSAVSSPSGVWGRNRIWCVLALKSDIWWQ